MPGWAIRLLPGERLNRLQDSSQKYVTQIGEKTRALVAGGSMSSRGAQRQNEEAQLRQGWMNAGGTDTDQGYQNELDALKKYYAAQDELRGNWQAGAKSAWADYADSAADAYGSMKSAASATFDGISQNMADMLTTGKANWADFTRSTLSMLTRDPDEAGHGWLWSVLPLLRWVLLAVVLPGPAVSMSLQVWCTVESLSLRRKPPTESVSATFIA